MKCCKGTGVYAIQQQKTACKNRIPCDVFLGGLDGDNSPSPKKHVS